MCNPGQIRQCGSKRFLVRSGSWYELTWNNDGVCLLPVLAETAHTAEGLQEFLQIREKLLLDLENTVINNAIFLTLYTNVTRLQDTVFSTSYISIHFYTSIAAD